MPHRISIYTILIVILFAIIIAPFSSPDDAAANGSPQRFNAVADTLVYKWDNHLYARSIDGSEFDLGPAFTDVELMTPDSVFDVYSLAASPLTQLPPDGYGFHHGVWSPDRTQFVYMEIANGGPTYRIKLITSQATRTLLVDEISAARGYLDPIGWLPDGDVLLLERYTLHNLFTGVRIWRINPTTNELLYYVGYSAFGRLRGQTAVTSDGRSAFIGFKTDSGIGYIFDFETRGMFTFPSTITFPASPSSIFELYPLEIIGMMTGHEFNEFSIRIATETPIETRSLRVVYPAPFLYWSLPTEQRTVTCYPDSNFTRLNWDFTCPGFARRNYDGHEGTDVGGGENGLALGTNVYPAAAGTVVATYHSCTNRTPACGDAYGNVVLMEHTLVAEGDIQTWFTGYAHLSAVLVQDYTYIRPENFSIPIALSGDTGVGGLHLHIEVRYPHGGGTRWVDPWDTSVNGSTLWIMENAQPTAAASVGTNVPAEILCIVTTDNAYNLRTGPGTAYPIFGETTVVEQYEVVQIAPVFAGESQGDWYRVRFNAGTSVAWLWSGLTSECVQAG